MKFRNRAHTEPEINLIPFIDVLLVILIFLVLTTTYSRFTELKVNLPTANASAEEQKPQQITVSVSADGEYAINGSTISARDADAISAQLAPLAGENVVLVISADAVAPVQSVVTVMDAARRQNLSNITFSAQSSPAQ